MKEPSLIQLIKDGNTTGAIKYINDNTTYQLNYEEPDHKGKTPFHWAVKKKNISVIEALVAKLSDWALNLTDNKGQTAVNYASLLGEQDLINAVSGTSITNDYFSIDL